MKFATKPYDSTHLTLGMLLHYLFEKGPFKDYVTVFFTTFWTLPLCHILSHIRRPLKNYVTLTYPPNATDCIPNIESEIKILPNIICIIRYSGKHQVLLSQCDMLNVSKHIGSHYSVSPQSMVMTGGQIC